MKVYYKIDPWARLAAAVLALAQVEHDGIFLKSNWADILRSMVQMEKDKFESVGDYNGLRVSKMHSSEENG